MAIGMTHQRALPGNACAAHCHRPGAPARPSCQSSCACAGNDCRPPCNRLFLQLMPSGRPGKQKQGTRYALFPSWKKSDWRFGIRSLTVRFCAFQRRRIGCASVLFSQIISRRMLLFIFSEIGPSHTLSCRKGSHSFDPVTLIMGPDQMRHFLLYHIS